MSIMMTQSVRIILPVFPLNETIFFKGFSSVSENKDLIIYITDYTPHSKSLAAKETYSDDTVFGYCSCRQNNKVMNSVMMNVFQNNRNTVVLENYNGIRVKKIRVNGLNLTNTENNIIILYNHEKFRNSETVVSDSNDYFSKLHILLKDDSELKQCSYEPVIRSPHWLSSSMFVQHIVNYLNLINWLFTTVRREKRISIKPGNLILAILTDIALGYLFLQLLTQDKKELSAILMDLVEKMVNLLYSLLKWLMGSPAGLKLNNAFNKMLGKYFSYHIKLWWLFIDVSGEKLHIILHVYHYLGYLGLTFQAAVISDMICIATFHAYCIYVYVARLFNIQISGLIALLRLFVGRKYNPLRGGIDSCEYTNQELFVGTVAITILLLLLPTTTMYYIVFTLFRLLSLEVQYILANLIYVIQTLPLYVASLWLVHSPKVAGNIFLKVENEEEGAPLVLKVQLLKKSLTELVNKFKPPAEAPAQFEWTDALSKILRGKQIT